MINSITVAISQGIAKEFGEKYTIYTDEIKQGFKEPCFFIQPITSNEKQVLSSRYQFRQSFVIQYFNNSTNSELYETAERLMRVLEYAFCVDETTLRGLNRSYRIIDGVVNVFVDYNYYAYEEREKEAYIETLNNDIGIKKEVENG